MVNIQKIQSAKTRSGLRTEGNKRNTFEEQEESMLRKTVKYLNTLERTEAKKESEATLEVVELAEVEVNEEEEEEEEEEEVEWRAEGDTQFEEEGGDLDLEQVRQGREKEVNDMVNVRGMFEFGLWEEATSKAGQAPTTTKWIDRAKKDDDGREFARCLMRDLKPRWEGPRDCLFAAMPPLEATKGLFCSRRRDAREETRTRSGSSDARPLRSLPNCSNWFLIWVTTSMNFTRIGTDD